MAALGLIFAGKNAPAGTLLQEYLPLHVGDHYTSLTAAGTNTVNIEAGVAKYPGSFAVVTLSPVSGAVYTNFAYVGYSGNSEVTYELDTGSNTVAVLTPPLVTMTESALASLGTPFTGTSSYTNSVVDAGQSFDTVVSETISGVVSSTGTVTVVAGTFNNCLASAETITTTTTTMGFSTTNTFSQTLFYAPNVGCLKVVQGGTNVYELLGGVVGGVTVGGGGGDTQPPTIHITSPADGATVAVNSVAVQGTASDNVGVVAVFCRVDGGSWSKAQGTANWSFQASLSPGANVIEAYAADAAGNLSTTNQVSVTYTASAQTGSLQVTITPSAAVGAGAEWQVNEGAYQKSAATVNNLSAGAQTVSFKPISGWNTPSSETVTITSGATTKAAGVYTQEVKGNPKLTLSSPKSAQSVSNALLRVTGTVSDKVAVDDVYYQLNGGSWTLATSTNSWTNWTATVTLNPGANTLSAYAQDSSGKTSPTNTVKFTYVVSAPLVVQVIGLGKVSPNYNGQWLKIGTRYTMTATAGKGFGFLKWSGSLSTNKPMLAFVMASNLTFTANFVDVTPPVAIILSPKVHQNVSNAVFTVTGKASDNVGVTQVFYQLNGAGWDVADTTNGWTNWTAGVTLNPGTNLVRAYAEDAAGNRSKTNSASFVYVQPIAYLEYWPLVVGSQWTYEPGFGQGPRVDSVTGVETVQGVRCYKWERQEASPDNYHEIRWLFPEQGTVTMYQIAGNEGLSMTGTPLHPPWLMVKPAFAPSEHWTQQQASNGLLARFTKTVYSTNGTAIVPAGTFANCLVLRELSEVTSGGNTQQTYTEEWFAPGVGLVMYNKYSDAWITLNHSEQLTSYRIGPN